MSDRMHVTVVQLRLASHDVAARFIHKTAYQTALNFHLLQPTNEQTVKACIWIFISFQTA